ncbi:MAG: molybdenum cofactor guanylyltransferase [Methanobacteriaceae archaeon]|nr:molybdenum cofactor guanylyltransferase [Methanobacteriaceae archaeon]MDP3623388.1 molybdenum cofactor guanylyltransferase [Methanobacteriaceae archaeon]
MLCGGLSTRMGEDKGLMDFKGEPLILNILKTVNKFANEVLLIFRDDIQLNKYKTNLKDIISFEYFNFNLKFFVDEFKGKGPLAGILVGLSNINNEYALVLPCDSPFVSEFFINSIFSKMEISNENYDSIVPQWKNGDLEPLHSIYTVKTKNIILKMISNDKRDVKSFIGEINSLMASSEILDPTGMSFKNFNKPEDIII